MAKKGERRKTRRDTVAAKRTKGTKGTKETKQTKGTKGMSEEDGGKEREAELRGKGEREKGERGKEKGRGKR